MDRLRDARRLAGLGQFLRRSRVPRSLSRLSSDRSSRIPRAVLRAGVSKKFDTLATPRIARSDFLFDCFPETRLIILVREPRPTIFSMLSRWVFLDRDESIEIENSIARFWRPPRPGTRSTRFSTHLRSCTRPDVWRCATRISAPRLHAKAGGFSADVAFRFRQPKWLPVKDSANKNQPGSYSDSAKIAGA